MYPPRHILNCRLTFLYIAILGVVTLGAHFAFAVPAKDVSTVSPNSPVTRMTTDYHLQCDPYEEADRCSGDPFHFSCFEDGTMLWDEYDDDCYNLCSCQPWSRKK